MSSSSDVPSSLEGEDRVWRARRALRRVKVARDWRAVLEE